MFEGPHLGCLSIPGFPDLDTLHRRLIAGMPGARDELARSLLTLVRPRFRGRRWSVDPDVVEECIEDAVLGYLNAPETYDSRRASLDRFVAFVAKNKLIDHVRQAGRRLRHEVPAGGKLPDVADRNDQAPRIWHRLRAVLTAARTKGERAFLGARLRGERRAEALGKILGIDHLPICVQRTEIHRTWMRLRLRILREHRLQPVPVRVASRFRSPVGKRSTR